MPAGLSSFSEAMPATNAVAFLPATGTNYQTLITGLYSSFRVDAILATNSDSVDHVVLLALNQSGTRHVIGSATIPAGAGTGGAAAVDVLALAMPATVAGIPFVAVESLDAKMVVAVGAGNTVELCVVGGYF